jgi:hypothetical protein
MSNPFSFLFMKFEIITHNEVSVNSKLGIMSKQLYLRTRLLAKYDHDSEETMRKQFKLVKSIIVYFFLPLIYFLAQSPAQAKCSEGCAIWFESLKGENKDYFINLFPDDCSPTDGYFPSAWMVTLVQNALNDWNNFTYSNDSSAGLLQ